jgi:hypothetical protein
MNVKVVAAKSSQQTFECKQCHLIVPAEETVAYHLVDRVLYGWCAVCFGRRPRPVSQDSRQLASGTPAPAPLPA